MTTKYDRAITVIFISILVLWVLGTYVFVSVGGELYEAVARDFGNAIEQTCPDTGVAVIDGEEQLVVNGMIFEPNQFDVSNSTGDTLVVFGADGVVTAPDYGAWRFVDGEWVEVGE